MKTKIAALALVLFATASTAALAQDQGEGRRERYGRQPQSVEAPRESQGVQREFQRREERDFQRDTPRERPTPQPQTQAPEARAVPDTRPNVDAREGRGGGWRNGGEGRRTDAPPTAERQGRDGLANGGQWSRNRDPQTPSTDPSAERSHRSDGGRADRWDRNDRNRDGQWDGRNRQGRDGQWDGRNRQGRDGQWDGRNRDGRDGRDGRWDGRDGRGRDGQWDGRRDGGHRWDRNQFRPNWQSPRRYRGPVWRPPIGFYAYSWSFGDFLPRAWYQNDYRILNWWSYGLPEPPPGCYWVRVGYDAILIDDFDGQVLEVVRMLFY